MTHLLSRTECYWNNCNDLITLKVIIFNKKYITILVMQRMS